MGHHLKVDIQAYWAILEYDKDIFRRIKRVRKINTWSRELSLNFGAEHYVVLEASFCSGTSQSSDSLHYSRWAVTHWGQIDRSQGWESWKRPSSSEYVASCAHYLRGLCRQETWSVQKSIRPAIRWAASGVAYETPLTTLGSPSHVALWERCVAVVKLME